MISKARVNLTMDAEIVKKAKALGLNISKISENAIISYIERLEGISVVKNPENDLNSIEKKDGGPGRIRTNDYRDVNAVS
jgi:hypothetical protein